LLDLLEHEGGNPLGGLNPNIFLEEDIPDVITCFKFGDDRFRGSCMLLFSVDSLKGPRILVQDIAVVVIVVFTSSLSE